MPMTSPPKRRGGGGPLDPGDELFTDPTVANLAALVALPVGVSGATTAMPEGWEVYVQTLRTKWRLRTTAVAPVAFQILTSTSDPTRQWWREDCEASDANPWLDQLAWTVNPATGNDEALGTAAAPLLSLAEFSRRMRGARCDAAYSLSVLGNVTGITLEIHLGPNGMLVVDGNLGAVVAPAWPANVQCAAVASYTPPNAALQQYAIIDVDTPPLFDWTPYVGLRVRFSDVPFPHANNLDRGEFIVELVNPALGGNNTARISLPNNCDVYAAGGPALTGAVPNDTDFLLCEVLPRSGPIRADITKEFGPVITNLNITGFDIADLGIGTSVSVRFQSVNNASPFGVYGNPTIYGCTAALLAAEGAVAFWECGFTNPGANGELSGDGSNLMAFWACAFLNYAARYANCRYTSCLWQVSILDFAPGFHHFVGPCCWSDNAGVDTMTVFNPGVHIRSVNQMFGNQNGHAINIESPGLDWVYQVAPTINALDATEFRVMGVEYTWAANLPYPDAGLVYPATVHDVAIFPLTV